MLTLEEYEHVILRSVFAALREAAPDYPGLTPEMLATHLRMLEIGERALLMATRAAALARERGMRVQGLN